MQTLEFRAMGSRIFAALDTDRPAAGAALQTLPEIFARWEGHLSRFRPHSELNRLNQAGAARVSPLLYQVLLAARRAAAFSNGLINPLILPALEQAGYQTSFSHLATTGKGQRSSPRGAARPAPPWQQLQLRPQRQVRLPPGGRIDLGGIAKGWAATQAARLLAAHAPALVDAGGDIALSGPPADDTAWPIGVADPRCDAGELALLLLKGGGVATSGIDYRRWQIDGVWQHHLIDPRSGRPAAADLLSVTVVGPDLLRAETAAKAALILGSKEGRNWIEARPQLAALFVRLDGSIIYSNRIRSYLYD